MQTRAVASVLKFEALNNGDDSAVLELSSNPKVPDLQCAWQLLVQCAGPRCHHFLRTVPPSQSRVSGMPFCTLLLF